MGAGAAGACGGDACAKRRAFHPRPLSESVGAWEIGVVLALVAVVLFLFVREVLPVAVTAILAAALLMLIPARGWDGAILSPEEGLSGFSSPATVAVLAMFVLSAGIQRVGAVEYVAQGLMKWAGTSARRQTLSLGAVAGPVSGFINNTAVVAVLIPVATRLARGAGVSPSKLLMPLSIFAMLGGTLTLIGTSTNLLGNALVGGYGIEPFGFFSFTLVGVVTLVVAVLYFFLIGSRLVPDHGAGDVVERFDLRGFMAEFEVPGDSAAVGKSLSDLGMVRAQGMQVIRVFRAEHVLASPRHSFVLREGDLVLVQGSRDRLEELPERAGLRSLAELKHGLQEAGEQEDERVATAELIIAPGSRLEGRSVAEARFRDRYGVLVLAIRHRDRVAIGPLAKTKLSPGDVLLVQGHPDALSRLQESAQFYLTRERPRTEFRRDKIALAVSIILAVVVVSALGWTSIVAAALGGAVAMVLTGCLRIEEFIDSVHWDIILLLAGIIPLGVALERSGAAELGAAGLTDVGVLLPPLGFLVLVYAVTSLITEMVSNNASVVLLIPVVVTAAQDLGLDGRPFALAVMLSASTSMLTPIGYQTNTMVYAPGSYRFTDYLRVGGPLNLILMVVVPLTIAWLFPLK